MLKKILMAGLAVGAMALNAPIAHADAPTFDCGFNSVQQADATGQNYEGAVYGYVVDTDATAVSIHCYITVNGTPVQPGVSGSGTVAATAQGRVTFSATDTDDVKLVAEATVTHAGVTQTYTSSGDSDHTQIPPQEVFDALDTVFAALDGVLTTVDGALAPVYDLLDGIEKTYVDPAVCPVLAAVAGDYGPITINAQGDIFIDGEAFWDCPPYDLFS